MFPKQENTDNNMYGAPRAPALQNGTIKNDILSNQIHRLRDDVSVMNAQCNAQSNGTLDRSAIATPPSGAKGICSDIRGCSVTNLTCILSIDPDCIKNHNVSINDHIL